VIKILPLEGITVVSVEQAVAAPFATRQLADLGARVIKIERPDGGDFARSYDSVVDGLSSHFVWLNRGKESVTLDLKTPDANAVFYLLVDRADVVVQNLAPGAGERLGIDTETLRAARPQLITCDISGYGKGGPMASRPAYDLLVQAESGLISITGHPGHPAKTGVAAADIAAGTYACNAILAALLRRTRTGEGTAISVSLFDAISDWMGHSVHFAMATGVSPGPTGLSHPVIAPYDSYRTLDDQQVVIGVQNDRQWARLAREVMDRSELATDADFATNEARCRNRARVDAAVATAIGTMPMDDAVRRLDAAAIPNARIKLVGDLLVHPQLVSRNRFREIGVPSGRTPALLPPAEFADFELRMGPVPALGEHTEAVLAEFGCTPQEIDQLRP
jgi:crotonobetainyl-CoA:carnitine CoA-transferase CaiB-like acyl-CoA transferase